MCKGNIDLDSFLNFLANTYLTGFLISSEWNKTFLHTLNFSKSFSVYETLKEDKVNKYFPAYLNETGHCRVFIRKSDSNVTKIISCCHELGHMKTAYPDFINLKEKLEPCIVDGGNYFKVVWEEILAWCYGYDIFTEYLKYLELDTLKYYLLVLNYCKQSIFFTLTYVLAFWKEVLTVLGLVTFLTLYFIIML